MNADPWPHIVTLINLVTFFFAFSAFSVGLYISDRVKRSLGKGVIRRVVDAFLLAAAGLSIRTLMGVAATLGWVDPFFAAVVGELALLPVAAGLFWAYWSLDRHFRKLESRKFER